MRAGAALFPALLASMLALAGEHEPAPPCPPGNLLAGAEIVRAEHVTDAARTIDARVGTTGERCPTANASALGKPTSEIVYHLATPALIDAIFIQADGDDHYHVSTSVDGRSWRYVWQVPATTGVGLQPRSVTGVGTPAAFVRLHDPYGDGVYAVAEIAAYCRPPAAWPPELPAEPPAPRAGRTSASPWPSVRATKGVVGLLAIATFLAVCRWRRGGLRRLRLACGRRAALACGLIALALAATRSLGWIGLVAAAAFAVSTVLIARARAGAAWGFAALGLAAVLSWTNFLEFHALGTGFVHAHDAFHYYVGAKYFRELGYSRLYECAWLAEAESRGLGMTRERRLRDLETYEIYSPARSLADRTFCKSHFTEERWSEFRGDVHFFRGEIDARLWQERLFRDQGFNGTPLWIAMAGPFLHGAPLSESRLVGLALLDPLLYAGLFAALWWAFGLPATTLALVAWGVGYESIFEFTGGAFLRVPWLFFLVLSACLIHKGKPLGGGLCLGISALLQLFPALFVLGLGLQAVVQTARRSLPRFHVRVAAGVLAAIVLGLGLVWWSGVDGGAYATLVRKLVLHENRQFLTYRGLQTLVSYRADNRIESAAGAEALDASVERYIERRRETFRARRPIYWLGAAVALGGYGWFALRRRPWATIALGSLALFALVEAANYYFDATILLLATLAVRPLALAAAFICAALVDSAIETALVPPEAAGALHAVVFLALVGAIVLGSTAARRRP